MRAIVTLALKDLRLLSRDWFGLFWMFGFPLMFALFFGAIFSGMDGQSAPLGVCIVDEDQSDGSKKLTDRLQKSPALWVQAMSKEESHAKVLTGKMVAYVVLKKGFGKSANVAGNKDVYVEVGIDPSRKAEKEILRGILLESFFAGVQDQLPKGFVKFFPEMPMAVSEVTPENRGPRSSFEVTFPSSIIWGIIGCVTGFAISLVHERVHGTLQRLRVAPLATAQVLAGKGLACFLACTCVAIVLLAIAVLILGVRVEDSLQLAMAIVANAVCFVGIMMLVSTLGKTEQAVAGAGWGILMPLSMLGGAMVPLFVMPSWMLTAGNISPVKWGILALEGAIWRGYSLSDMLLPCGLLVGIGVGCYALGVLNFARQEN